MPQIVDCNIRSGAAVQKSVLQKILTFIGQRILIVKGHIRQQRIGAVDSELLQRFFRVRGLQQNAPGHRVNPARIIEV